MDPPLFLGNKSLAISAVVIRETIRNYLIMEIKSITEILFCLFACENIRLRIKYSDVETQLVCSFITLVQNIVTNETA